MTMVRFSSSPWPLVSVSGLELGAASYLPDSACACWRSFPNRKLDARVNAAEDIDRNEDDKDLTLLGLVGLYGPPRPQSAAVVRQRRGAGIAVHMLTDGYRETARRSLSRSTSFPKRLDRVSADVAGAMG
ncbi:hypothetical protein VTK56DRAFT_6738 [Thermocarpiscus australiensis]